MIDTKNGKRPTKKQKQIISGSGLNPDNWLVVKNPTGAMHLVHRLSGKGRVLKMRRAM